MDTRPGKPVQHPSGADVPPPGGEAEYFARAGKPRRGPAPRPKPPRPKPALPKPRPVPAQRANTNLNLEANPLLPVQHRPAIERAKTTKRSMSATGRDLHVDNFMKPKRRGAVTSKGGGMSASIKGAMARNAAAAEAMARAQDPVTTSSTRGGKTPPPAWGRK